jgi:hypothetical protein
MSSQDTADATKRLHARIVGLIADGRAELAMKLLSEYYGIDEPDLRVGTVKRHRKVVACYVDREKRIYLSKSDYLTNSFVILHEFYHHLRASQPDKRRQIDKRADQFALRFLRDFVSQQQSTWRRNR